MNPDIATDAGVLFEAGQQTYRAPETITEGGVPFVIIPDGVNLQNVENLLPLPIRKRSNVEFRTVESFSQYVIDFKESLRTAIFADDKSGVITAIIDYHDSQGKDAGWCDHRATFTPELSDDWKAWTAKNKQMIPQVQFAEFLEDHLPNIAEPDGAKLLEVATFLESNVTTQFKSGVNLQNGLIQLTYIQDADTATEGKTSVPGQLKLALSPYKSQKPFVVDARLRYRIVEKKLSFSFTLERHQEVLEAAFADFTEVAKKMTGLEPYLAAAPKGQV